MELRQLEYFATVCQELSFVRASQTISISQQALSKSIQLLEDELGVPLFKREPRNLVLTKYGEVLLKNVQIILSILCSTTKQLEQMKQNEKSILRFAFTDGIEDYQKFGGFSMLYPEYKLSSIATTDKEIEKSLLSGQIEFAISSAVGRNQMLNYKVLYTSRAYLIVGRRSPLNEKESVTIPELRDQILIFAPADYNVGANFIDLCKRAGFVPQIMHQTGNLNYIAHLIATQQGIFICPETTRAYFDKMNFKSIVLSTDQPIFSICFVTRKSGTLPLGVKLFEEFYTELSKQSN